MENCARRNRNLGTRPSSSGFYIIGLFQILLFRTIQLYDILVIKIYMFIFFRAEAHTSIRSSSYNMYYAWIFHLCRVYPQSYRHTFNVLHRLAGDWGTLKPKNAIFLYLLIFFRGRSRLIQQAKGWDSVNSPYSINSDNLSITYTYTFGSTFSITKKKNNKSLFPSWSIY